MKKQTILIWAAIIAALAGCAKDELEQGNNSAQQTITPQIEIEAQIFSSVGPAQASAQNPAQNRSAIFSPESGSAFGNNSSNLSGNNATTKAPLIESGFPTGVSNIGLFFMNAGATAPYLTGADNMLLELTSPSTIKYFLNDGTTPHPSLTFKSADNVTLWGYYPRSTSAVTPTAIPFDLSTTEQQNLQTDIIYFPKQTVTKTNASNLPLKFKHAFAVIELRIRKSSNSTQVTTTGATIKGYDPTIKGTIDPSTGAITSTGTGTIKVNYPAQQSALKYGAYTSFYILVPPFAKSDLSAAISVTFDNGGRSETYEFPFTKEHLTSGKLETGKKYTFNLLMLNGGVGNLEVEGWSNTGLISQSPGGTKPVMMHEGGHTTTTSSYNSYLGEIGKPDCYNGTYVDSETEPFYYNLELDKTDVYNNNTMSWRMMRDMITMDGDICKKMRGKDWRMSRASEIEQTIKQSEAQQYDNPGLVIAKINYIYLSGSEADASNAWGYSTSLPLQHKRIDKDLVANYAVRCVREWPEKGKEPIIIFGTLPYNEIGEIAGSTTASYNNYYGLVENGTNGEYMTPDNILNVELPYRKLEVARFDIMGNSDDTYPWDGSWLEATGANLNQPGSDLCAKQLGRRWRIPRASELCLIVINDHLLQENSTGYTHLTGALNWSATEHNVYPEAAGAWACGLGNPYPIPQVFEDRHFVRCVSELPISPTILEFGGENGTNTTDLLTPTSHSYNGLFGMSDLAFENWVNGTPEIDRADAMLCERPYYKLEIAKENTIVPSATMDWHTAQGTAKATPHGDICATTRGPQWRLPRGSELRLIANNMAAINNTELFTPFNSNEVYWSSTQFYDGTNNLIFALEGNSRINIFQPTETFSVRCVREFPTPSPTLLIFAKLSNSGEITKASKASYNHLYGESEATNGYRPNNLNSVYDDEPPFPRLEISREYIGTSLADVVFYDDANGIKTPVVTWRNAQGTGGTYKTNVCRQALGLGWRMPRFSELRLMYLNYTYLKESNKFMAPFIEGVYWSATERDDDGAWAIRFPEGTIYDGTSKENQALIRCVREV